jgi:hypothetical protein
VPVPDARVGLAFASHRAADLERSLLAIEKEDRPLRSADRDEPLPQDDLDVVVHLERRADRRADPEQHLEVGLAELPRRLDRLAGLQVLAQPGEKLLGEERLGQVVVRSGLETGELVLQLVQRGDHQDRDLGGRGVGFDPAADLVAVDAGKPDVEKDDVGPDVLRHLERLRSVFGQVHLEPFGLELLAEDPSKEVRVVHDQDGLTHGRCRGHDAHRSASCPAGQSARVLL